MGEKCTGGVGGDEGVSQKEAIDLDKGFEPSPNKEEANKPKGLAL